MIGHKTAIFRQVSPGKPVAHHDALEFPDGRIVLLTSLTQGQHATVLQLPAAVGTKAPSVRPLTARLAGLGRAALMQTSRVGAPLPPKLADDQGNRARSSRNRHLSAVWGAAGDQVH